MTVTKIPVPDYITALASAGDIGPGAAEDIADSAMTQFGLAGGTITRIADLLSAACTHNQRA